MLGIVVSWKCWGTLALGYLLTLPSPVSIKDPERFLREGHAAFARGDYAGAAALYEQAGMYSTDPARVAFYLAGAKYHLAARIEGLSP